MMAKVRVAIVVPFLNEERSIPAFCASLLSSVRAAARPDHISVVFVDNGSTDCGVDLLTKATCDLGDVATVRLVTAPEPGAGNARRTGVAAALALEDDAETAVTRRWILNTDIDCLFPLSFVNAWLNALEHTNRHLLAGGFRFNAGAWAPYPVSREIYLREASVRTTLEAAYGVVNPPGANFAIAAHAYTGIGGFRQPMVYGTDGPAAGGEDWDLGERTRAAGLRTGSAPVTVTTSARRLRRSPRAFVTGCSYFREAAARSRAGADVTRDERNIVAGIARHHTLMHWGCKPFLVDETVRRCALSMLPTAEAKRVTLWLGANLESVWSIPTSTELYKVLAGFSREFGTALLDLADSGAKVRPVCKGDRTTRGCKEEL